MSEGAAMGTLSRCWTAAFITAGLLAAALQAAATAGAECVNSGGATVCAQGQVRGSGQPPPPTAGPYVPYPCDYDPYCYDGGLSIIIDPGWGGGNGGGNGGPILPRPTPR